MQQLTTTTVELLPPGTTQRKMYVIGARRVERGLALHKIATIDASETISYGSEYMISHMVTGWRLFTGKLRALSAAFDELLALPIDWTKDRPLSGLPHDVAQQIREIRDRHGVKSI